MSAARRPVLLAFSLGTVVLLMLLYTRPCEAAQTRVDTAWRLAYIETTPHAEFTNIVLNLAKALEKQGLIPKVNIPPDLRHHGKALWQWLSRNTAGGKIQFLPDGYYTAARHSEQRLANKNALLRRIREQGDVDLLLALGTRAGMDMATDEHSVPTFVLGSTDPLHAGITRTLDDSGRDHVFVQTLPRRQQRQLQLFHKMFQFKRLGVMYEDTQEGRALVGMHNVEEAARQDGYTLVHCRLDPSGTSQQRDDNLRQCLQQLAASSDAVYLTYALDLYDLSLGEVLQPFIKAEIPSFSQRGVADTREGALMSLSEWNYIEMGQSVAQALQQVMQGATPRSLEQEFTARLGLAINLRMAALIDWDMPPAALVAVDELCDQVATPFTNVSIPPAQ